MVRKTKPPFAQVILLKSANGFSIVMHLEPVVAIQTGI
jgi:hypothetical protein